MAYRFYSSCSSATVHATSPLNAAPSSQRIMRHAARKQRTRWQSAVLSILAFLLLPPPAIVATASVATAEISRIVAVYANAGDSRNRGQWGAVMPAACAGKVRVDLAQPVRDGERSMDTGNKPDTAVRVDFDLPIPGWCGLVVLMQDGNWGAQPGPALSATGASALVFRARGERGGERVRIKAAIVPAQPFGDSAALPLDSGWVELSSDWQHYRIDATERDLTRVITPFVVIGNDSHNPSGRLSVFFDDIRYEWDR